MRSRGRWGYTLIEFLVVVSIIGLVSSVGMLSFQRTSSKQVVEGTAERIKQNFSLARSNAKSGKKDCSVCGVGGVCTGNDKLLKGWEVEVNVTDPANKYMSVRGVCSNADYPTVPLTYFPTDAMGNFYKESLPTTTTITVTGATLPQASGGRVILFQPATGGVYPAQGSGTIQITVSDTFSNSKQVIIDGSGQVSLQ